MTTYPSAPMPDPDLLDLIATDHVHADDRGVIEAAITSVGADGFAFSANDVRRHLSRDVTPQLLGATVSALARSGRIVAVGWVINDGVRSRNRGKPLRTYVLSGDPDA